jgi:hypothetical protein
MNEMNENAWNEQTEDEESQEFYHDQADIMYELVRQFVESLEGNETREELLKMIDEEAGAIHEQAPVMDVECIKSEIMFRLPEWAEKLCSEKKLRYGK